MKAICIFLLIISCTSFVNAQFNVCGTASVNGTKQQNIRVVLVGEENTDTVYTTKNGRFCFLNKVQGNYILQAFYDDIHSQEMTIQLNENQEHILLEVTSEVLETVTIQRKKNAEIKKEHLIKTEVVDVSAHENSATSVEELLNKTAGIKVRNTSGLGGEADIVVGGFNGKSVKYLIDGIPIDYLGSSMSVTKIPTNMADYIEIYKGVLPTEIGIDALGAAVNIVTKTPRKTGHKISYEIGSFNTHRFTLNSFVKLSEKTSFGINVFANYSDNNFKVKDLPIEDAETGKTIFITAPLFHNAYKQVSGELYFELEKRKWADKFRITLNSYGLQRELQNDFASRNRPYGAVTMKEHTYAIPSVHYQKSFLDKRLTFSQFAVFSLINYSLMDSLKNGYYDWKGKFHDAISGSETGLDLSNLEKPIIQTQIKNFTSRSLLTYRFKNQQRLIFNVINNLLFRTADNLGQHHAKTDILYNRLIAGLGYQYYFFDKKLEGLSQVKYLQSHTETRSTTPTETITNQGGSFAQSFKFQTNGWLIRISAENTYRLPDQAEVFGDNVFIIPNLTLKPEKSININAGFGYTDKKYFRLEINSYTRFVKDMIQLKEITQFQANYLNLNKVQGYGIELEMAVYPVKRLEIAGNLTYNEFRLKGFGSQLLKHEHFINARVSNMPFYFGNAFVNYQFDKLFSKKDKLKIYYTYSYVHQFYLDYIEKQYEPNGFLGLFGQSKVYTNRVIPIQHVQSLGFTWSMKFAKERTLFFSGELHNIFNTPVYNNFKMQSAGRSFYAKISFEF